MLDSSPPPSGFSTGKYWSSPITVYRMLHPDFPDRIYWLRDGRGFLGSCSTLDELNDILRAESQRPPEPYSRPRYWPRARDYFFPGHAEEVEAKALEVDSIRVPFEAPAKPGKAKLSLADIGL